MSKRYKWNGSSTITSKNFRCGICNEKMSTDQGFIATRPGHDTRIHMSAYICSDCECLSFFNTDGKQYPGESYGENVSNISDGSVEGLFEEAKNAYCANAYTSVVLSCRKLLMHIAVSKGADKGKSFIEYVEYLSASNYIPPDAKDWVDYIRSKGNEANHEIVLSTREDARNLIDFSIMLLKLIYDFPARVKPLIN